MAQKKSKPQNKWQRHPFAPPAADEVLLRSSEVADWLGTPTLTLRWWRRTRKGPSYVLIEGRPRYRAGDIRKYIDANKPSRANAPAASKIP